jgi:prepilin-type N-terminal cleavage/methylation domain-containing protein
MTQDLSRLRRQSGYTLTELCVVLAVLLVLLASSLPSLSSILERQRLQGAAESLRSDYQQARMLALGTGRSVRMGFVQAQGGSCYWVYQGPLGACTCGAGGQVECRAGAQLQSHQWLPERRGLSMAANVQTLTIDGKRGTVTPAATVRLSSRDGAELSHVVAQTGRLRSCGSFGRACS